MTLKNPLKPLPPHGERRLRVHFYILVLLAVIAFCATHCTPKHGCYGTRGMSGYGIIERQISKDGISVVYEYNKDTFSLDYLTRNQYDSLCISLLKKAKVPFVFWHQSKHYTILDSVGAIICAYNDNL